ncbi:MAG: hypothetical protein NTX09_00290 [Verrucomicrobia bacterium]|nr:hypothetical protein [Verrucomicrobiota bacterium]
MQSTVAADVRRRDERADRKLDFQGDRVREGLQIVKGNNNNQSDAVELFYAIVPFNLTADATLVPKLRPIAGLLRVLAGQAADAYDSTGIIVNNGGYLYTWFNSPALGGSPTITLVSVELP